MFSVRCGSIRNLESARVSIIGQLKKFNTAISANEQVPTSLGSQSGMVMQTELKEEDESNDDASTEVESLKITEPHEEFLKPEVK